MNSHVLVWNALEADLKSRGYAIRSWQWKSPLLAEHPDGEPLEIDFYGENSKVDESAFPFKLTRQEHINMWKFEQGQMNEEASSVCVCKAVCRVIAKLTTRKEGRRIGLCFPDTNNFMNYLQP